MHPPKHTLYKTHKKVEEKEAELRSRQEKSKRLEDSWQLARVCRAFIKENSSKSLEMDGDNEENITPWPCVFCFVGFLIGLFLAVSEFTHTKIIWGWG